MWRLDTPVRAGDEDVVAAVVERRWEITKEDPVWESVIVKALAADKTRAKRRKMVWYVFIVVNYCAMGIFLDSSSKFSFFCRTERTDWGREGFVLTHAATMIRASLA